MLGRTMTVFSRWIAGGMYQFVEQTIAVFSRRIVGGMYQCVEQNNGSVLAVDSWMYVPMCGAEQCQCSHGG